MKPIFTTTIKPSAQVCSLHTGSWLEWWRAQKLYKRGFLLTSPQILAIFGSSRVPKNLKLLLAPDGEAAKDIHVLNALTKEWLDSKGDKETPLLVLGGGSLGDLGGLMAALWRRGTPLVQIPSTLLAQIDSSVGGKAALDFGGYKNVVGCIRQPRHVIIDSSLLLSLPERDYRSGFGEIIKYALLSGKPMQQWLKPFVKAIYRREHQVLQDLALRCLKYKLDLVRRDPDDHNVRLFLNLGHTLGHALEAADKLQGLTHGEAVYWGLDFILGYSVEAGCMSAHSLKWARDILQILEWTPDKSKVSKDDVMAAFRHDKKGKQNSLRMVLLKEPGKPCLQEVLTKRVGQAAERWLKQNDFLHERVTSRTRKLVSQRKKRSKVKA